MRLGRASVGVRRPAGGQQGCGERSSVPIHAPIRDAVVDELLSDLRTMPLAHIANLWSLVAHPSPEREWTLEKKIRAVADAGFDGFTTALTPEHRALAEEYELEHLLGFISTNEPEEFAKVIADQKESGAVHINVQLDDHDTPPALAVAHWIEMERAAEKIGGVVLSLEVHRDTCTETPEKTYELAERYEKATGR